MMIGGKDDDANKNWLANTDLFNLFLGRVDSDRFDSLSFNGFALDIHLSMVLGLLI